MLPLNTSLALSASSDEGHGTEGQMSDWQEFGLDEIEGRQYHWTTTDKEGRIVHAQSA